MNELAHDKNDDIRVIVAHTADRRTYGDALRTLLSDNSPEVRIALAERGYGLDTLLNDKDENVRAAVAKHDEVYAEKLRDDKSEIVRNAARPEPAKSSTTKERE